MRKTCHRQEMRYYLCLHNERSSQSTRFGASQTVDGFQINDTGFFKANTHDFMLIHCHPFYFEFNFHRRKKKMRRLDKMHQFLSCIRLIF